MEAPRSPTLSEKMIEKIQAISPTSLRKFSGTWKISGELLYPPNPGVSNVKNFVAQLSSDVAKDLDIPIHLESPEALMFSGYNASTAHEIFQAWNENPYKSEIHGALDDFIISHIKETNLSPSCESTKDDWWEGMQKLGLGEEMQRNIMHPEFNDIRATRPLKAWASYFVETNWLILCDMNNTLENHLEDLVSRRISSLRGGGGGDGPHVSTELEWKIAGHTTLYRATTAQRLKAVYKDDGTIHLQKTMEDIVAGDFSWTDKGYYWTPQKWVAERYAMYCSQNCKVPGNVVIIRMVCPSYEVDGKAWRLEYGDDWRKLLWYSRNRETYPEEIQKQRKSVIIGPLCVNHTKEITKMKTWMEISEKHVFSRNGEVGLQVAWVDGTEMQKIGPLVKQKLDLFKVFPQIKHIPNPKGWIEGRPA